MSARRVAPALGAALLVAASAARAQGLAGSLALEGASAWARSGAAGGTTWLRGTALRGEGRLESGILFVGADLLEGRLRSPAGAARRDLVEGSAFGGVRPWPWLELAAARRIRAYVADTTSERWSVWEARVRVSGPVLEPDLRSYAELWWAWSPQVNVQAPAGRVQGGQAGLVFQPASTLALRLSYRLDQALLAQGTARETLEALGLGVVLYLH